MRYLFTLTLLSIFATLSLSAQSKYKVDITVEDYANDTLLIGYYYGDRQLVQDTLYSKNKRDFTWTGDEELTPGVYLMMTFPSKEFLQFFVEEPMPKFKMSFSSNNLQKVTYKGSKDNEAFAEYVDFLMAKRPIAEKLQADIQAEKNKKKKAKLETQQAKIDKEVNAKQEQYVKQYPNTWTAKTIGATLSIDTDDPPKGLTKEEEEVYKYQSYRNHYFDHTPLSDSTLIYTPFFNNRVEYYLDKLTVQSADSIINSIDYLLDNMNPESKMYQYYVSSLYNKYARAKIIGMDKVIVHMADTYYFTGRAPWVKQETLHKIMDNANKVRPTLNGSIAKDIQLELKDGTPIKISDIDYEYLVMVFWAPDCGHCKKAMPHVVDFEEKYRDQNIKVMSICTKYQDKIPACWEAVEEKKMQNFINAVDPVGKSRFKIHYDVRQTPKIFILDKDRKIIIKGFGAEQLPDVMDQVIEIEGNKKKAGM